MGSIQVGGLSSLERLKALDTLPNLPTQLAEADRLCTHSARADMIVKWLLEKLKTNHQHRLECEVWRSLHRSCRMLAPDRLATLLTAQKFVDTICSTLDDTTESPELLATVAVILNHLLDLTQASAGASVKAVLSLPAQQAARLLGLALQRERHRFSAPTADASALISTSLLDPVQRLWTLRKPSVDEHIQFAQHCLVPAAMLLPLLANTDSRKPLKRKRSGIDVVSSAKCLKDVEALIAKHVFIPARTTCFKGHAPSSHKRAQMNGSPDADTSIESLLEPLRTASLAAKTADEPYSAALPRLLDISLRCVASPTLRQQTREQPWRYAVFEALLACNKKSSGAAMNRESLAEMLGVVGSRGILTRDALEDILRENTCVASGSLATDDTVELASLDHWRLVAAVVQLDASIFARTSWAAALFACISNAHARDSSSKSAETLTQEGQCKVGTPMLVDEIVAPVLEAFAQGRNLVGFVTLWSQQLEATPSEPVWLKLDRKFQIVREDFATEDETMELFEELTRPIRDTTSGSEQVLAARNLETDRLGPSMVILNALLGGLQSERLIDKIQDKCDELLVSLLNFVETDNGLPDCAQPRLLKYPGVWAVMTKLFALALSSWLVRDTSKAAIVDKFDRLMSRPAVNIALEIARILRAKDESHATTANEISDAESFIACVCGQALEFTSHAEGRHSTCTTIVKRLLEQADCNNLGFLVLRPSLLLAVEASSVRRTILLRIAAIKTGSNNYNLAHWSSDANIQLLAAVGQAHPSLLDDVVHMALQLFSTPNSDLPEHDREAVTLAILSAIPPDLYTRGQRERILNAVAAPERHVQTSAQGMMLQRLTLLVSLFALPNATANLSTDHTAFWRLGLGMTVEQYCGQYEDSLIDIERQLETPGVSALLEELAALIVRHLLSSQDQQRSCTVLKEISEDVSLVLECITYSRLTTTKVGGLSLCKVMMRELEAGAKDGLKQQFSYKSPEWSIKVTRQLIEASELDVKAVCADAASTSIRALQTILDTLSVVVDSIPQTQGATPALWLSITMARLLGSIRTSVSSKATSNPGFLFGIFVLGCKHIKPGNTPYVEDVALQLLKMQSSPEVLESLLAAFSLWAGRISGADRVPMLERLYASAAVLDQYNILLLMICLRQLEENDVEAHGTSTRFQLLPGLLTAVSESEVLSHRKQAAECILLILREKSFLINQYSMDKTLASLPVLLTRRQFRYTTFLDACRILSTLLLNYRARLQGRFHLVNEVYHMLICALFELPDRTVRPRTLGLKHAHALARALILFCEPPLLRRQAATSSLTNESRKEQAHVGQYAQYILHHYCTQVLRGVAGDGVKDALTPGLWAAIEAVEMNNADGMKSLAAAMSNSERAILRGVYDGWKRYGKWRGS